MVEYSGMLFKKRGGMGKHLLGAWQQRYFIMDNGILSYYENIQEYQTYSDKGDQEPRGRMDLNVESVTIVSGSSLDGAPNVFTIQLIPSNIGLEKWKLCASTKAEQLEWLATLMNYGEVGSPEKRRATISEDFLPKTNSPLPSSRINLHVKDATKSAPPNHSYKDSVTNKNDDEKIQPIKLFSNTTTTTTTTNTNTTVKPAAGGISSSHKKSRRPHRLSRMFHHRHIDTNNSDHFHSLLVLIIMNTCYYFVYTTLQESSTVTLPQSLVTSWINMFNYLNIDISSITIPHPSNMTDTFRCLFFIFIANFVVSSTLNNYRKRTTNSDNGSSSTNNNSNSIGMTTPRSRGLSFSSVHNSNGVDGEDAKERSSIKSEQQLSSSVVGVVSTTLDEDDEEEEEESSLLTLGSSFPKSDQIPPNVPDHCWSQCDHRHFQVRQVGYKKTGKKAPTAKPMYEPIAIDCFCMDSRQDHIATQMQLPDTTALRNRLNKCEGNSKSIPPLLIFQIQLPSDPPPSMMSWSTAEDGPGWAICVFFQITEDTLQELENPKITSNGVQLLKEFCEKAADDPAWRARFKVIASSLNLDELGFSSMITGWNAKPALIRRTSTIFKGVNPNIDSSGSSMDQPDYIEVDIHVHKFNNAAKSAVHMLSSRCSEMYMEIGILVESREDSELPEVLIGCAGLNKPQEDKLEVL